MEGQSETIRPPRRQWRRGDHERRDTRRPSEPTLKTEGRKEGETERQRDREKEGQRDDSRRRTAMISLSLLLSVPPSLLPSVSLSFCSRLLLLDLLPILKEIGQADVGQRVFEQLLNHLERHGGDVRAEPRRFDHVQRVADAGRQNLGVKSVVVVNLPNLSDQSHAFVADVVQAADERADESRSRFR